MEEKFGKNFSMLRKWIGLDENQNRCIPEVNEVESIRKPLIEEVKVAVEMTATGLEPTTT